MNSSPLDSRTSQNSDPKNSWSYGSQKELLELWTDGMDLELLACHLNRKQLEIIVKLSELILKAPQPVVDSSVPYFRKPWDYLQNSELRRLYALGKKAREIASLLGRDELGICFHLLSNFELVIPRNVVKKFRLDEVKPTMIGEPRTDISSYSSQKQSPEAGELFLPMLAQHISLNALEYRG